MAKYPYSPSPRDFVATFSRIATEGRPDKVDSKFLAPIHEQRRSHIITSLKQLGFIDEDGVPTERWLDYRVTTKAQGALTEAIHQAYAPLYAKDEDAHQQDDQVLEDFFREEEPSYQASTIRLLLRSYRELCVLAGLSKPPVKASPPRGKRKPKSTADGAQAAQPQPVPLRPPGVVVSTGTSPSKGSVPITINIQLTLPETKEAEVYDLFFAALKKHLLPD